MQLIPSLRTHMEQFDIVALGRSADSIYVLDSDLCLAGFNAAYILFARANGEDDITGRFPLGTPLQVVVHEQLWPAYERAYRLVLADGVPFTFDYECSSPQVYRMFRLHACALPDAAGLIVSHHQRYEGEYRAAGSFLETYHYTQHGFVVQCCHCRKIQDHRYVNKWDWVPSTLEDRSLEISHGVCPLCLDHYYPPAKEEAGH